MNKLKELNKFEISELHKSKLKEFLILKEEIKLIEDQLKEQFKELVESGIMPVNSITVDSIKFTYKSEYTKKSIDTEKLKTDGLYDKYCKESIVKSSVSISNKKEEE